MEIEKVHEYVFMSICGCRDQRRLQETRRPERNFCSLFILSTLLSLVFILRDPISEKQPYIVACCLTLNFLRSTLTLAGESLLDSDFVSIWSYFLSNIRISFFFERPSIKSWDNNFIFLQFYFYIYLVIYNYIYLYIILFIHVFRVIYISLLLSALSIRRTMRWIASKSSYQVHLDIENLW